MWLTTRTRQRQIGQAPVINAIFQLGNYSGDIFVGHRAEYREGIRMETHVVQILRQRGRRVRARRVVDRVQFQLEGLRQAAELARMRRERDRRAKVLREAR